MSHVLILGAGHSTPAIIAHLLEAAERSSGRVTVADLDPDLARRRLAGHPLGDAVRLDIEDPAQRAKHIEAADLVISMLAPRFQPTVARECVRLGRSMISTSYRDPAVAELDTEAKRRGVLLLSETGLDPGIDHMSAMDLLTRVRAEGGRVRAFRSYGAGVPAPDATPNRLRYVITWNPRNVVLAGTAGARYLEDGRVRVVPHASVFDSPWRVAVDGIGELEAYPNRDSLAYRDTFELGDARTMIRATMRWPGFCEIWSRIVRLGIVDERLAIPDLASRSFREVLGLLVPGPAGASVEDRVERVLGAERAEAALADLDWLGLLVDEPTGCRGSTAVDLLTEVLVRRLPLSPTDRDLVLLVHEIEVDYPERARGPERVTATMAVLGEPGACTAMARTVGLPAGVAASLVLSRRLSLVGSHIPTHPAVYEPVLRELRARGIAFAERVAPIPPPT